MVGKRDKPEEIVMKLRQVEVFVSQRAPVADAVRQFCVTKEICCLRRQEHGRLNLGWVKRLMELAYHPDITNVAGRCLWGMNGSVPEAADRAYLAGEVIKLLGLRSDDYLWEKGLRLLSAGITAEHLPALQALAKRETLPHKRREDLQELIAYIQPKP